MSRVWLLAVSAGAEVRDRLGLLDGTCVSNSERSAQGIYVMSTWQPIATAPKDGTGILAFERFPETSNWPVVYQIWVSHWWKGDALNSPRWGGGCYDGPSHWMPLPDPPTELMK